MTDLRDPLYDLIEQRQEELDRAYKLGVLHGINTQSMAQTKRDVMEFEDYGWSMDE